MVYNTVQMVYNTVQMVYNIVQMVYNIVQMLYNIVQMVYNIVQMLYKNIMLEYIIMNHYCDVCNMSLKSKINLNRHNNTNRHKKRASGNTIVYTCDCGKFYNHRPSFYRHKKECSYIPSNDVETNTSQVELLIKENQEMRERLDIKDREMNELRNQVELFLQQTGKNTTNNNSTIKNQTNIGNQYIVVNSFGNENTEHLTDQIICKLIQHSPFKCVPELIKKIHFDPEHPENHNIKLTNKKLNYAEIIKDNKWIMTNKKKVIDDVIQNSYNILDNSYTDNKDSISERQQERFDNFQGKYENEDETLNRNLKEEVDLLLINGTNEVHK